jgi:hypothetical protein
MGVEGESDAFLRPVGFLTYWLDFRIWGFWMPGYHLTQLALHVGTVAGVFTLLGARHNLDAWSHTSDLSECFLRAVTRELPSPPPDTQVVFSGIPETVRGVHLMRVSMTQPLWVAYDREDLRGYRQERLTEMPPGAVRFEWVGEDGGLIELRLHQIRQKNL